MVHNCASLQNLTHRRVETMTIHIRLNSWSWPTIAPLAANSQNVVTTQSAAVVIQLRAANGSEPIEISERARRLAANPKRAAAMAKAREWLYETAMFRGVRK